MEVELTTKLFRRLVWLYLLLIPVSVAVVALELLTPRWSAFDEAFIASLHEHFGATRYENAWLAGMSLALIANLVGSVGLLKLRRWGRAAFVCPILIMHLLDLLIGDAVAYLSRLGSLLVAIDMMIFGMITLLVYSRGHGSEWLSPQSGVSETV
jgi:hypothetical protein